MSWRPNFRQYSTSRHLGCGRIHARQLWLRSSRPWWLGIANTRMKDYYDLWVMATSFAFRGSSLLAALAATFRSRDTPLPVSVPVALGLEFSVDEVKQAQWTAFVRRSRLSGSPNLASVVAMLRCFLFAARVRRDAGAEFERDWPAGGDWTAS